MLLNCPVGKTLASPLDSKEIKPVNPKGNQPWLFIGRTNGEAETPIVWPLDVKEQKNKILGKKFNRRSARIVHWKPENIVGEI